MQHISPSFDTPSQTSSILDNLQSPLQLQSMTFSELENLGAEVRTRIIDVVSKNGGHLAPSLGVVELTLALLHCFDADKDKFVWDVGHQAYAWKLLTGRAKNFHSLRTLGGLSGFLKPAESPYDHFGVGHSSTSISAALGLAMARDLAEENHRVVAIIGDGSLTGGEAFEGLNLAGHMGKRFIVVLNDNEMSISPNVGALSRFLSRTLSRKWVRRTRKDVLKLLRSIPRIGNDLATYAIRGEWSFKSFFTPGMLFEAFRFNYIGPVDGHDLPALKRHLKMAAAVQDGPVLLHVLTRKGKGYAPAEKDPIHFHGVGSFEPTTGCAHKKDVAGAPIPTFTQVFEQCLTRLAEQDERIIAITAAMPEGTGTAAFQKKFPQRFVDVGICEQHAVTFAAGLAIQGLRPVVAIYSTFLQRAYDQIVHDVCLQNVPVIFCIDRAGFVGEDGPTHHGVFDIAFLRHIPHMRILAPRDEALLCHALFTATNGNCPVAVRYPRGTAFGVPVPTPAEYVFLQEGEGQLLQEGKDALIIAVGPCAHIALKAAQYVYEDIGLHVAVFDPIWLKPLPEKQLLAYVQQYSHILFIEEGCLAGGFSSAVLELFTDKGGQNTLNKHHIRRMGMADVFVEHGAQHALRELVGLSVQGIVKELYLLLNKDNTAFAESGTKTAC